MTREPAAAGVGKRARVGLALGGVAGLLIAIWMVQAVGWTSVTVAARRLGLPGFLLYCLYSLSVFGILGGAWVASAPPERWRQVPLFGWARLVREAASDLLPFAQLGGLVIGARVPIAAGMPPARVYASMVVDLTTEMASQLIFTLFGLALIASTLMGTQAAALRPLVLGGSALMGIMTLALFVGQRAILRPMARLARRLLPALAGGIGDVDAELGRIYRRRSRIAVATLLNLAGWVASAVGAWLLLLLAGRPMNVWTVLGLESLIFTVRSVAFFIPGAIGIQEAAYVLVGPLVGLPPDAALALSLGKRARELCLSVPALLIWYVGRMLTLRVRLESLP